MAVRTPSVVVTPTPSGKAAIGGVFLTPNRLLGPFAPPVQAAQPTGEQIFDSAPSIKYQLRVDPHPPNLLETQLFPTLPPFADQWSDSAPSVKYLGRNDPIPNNLGRLLVSQTLAPFLPQVYANTPHNIQDVTVDMTIAAYSPLTVAQSTQPSVLIMPTPRPRAQVFMEPIPNTLVRGLPGNATVPVSQNRDFTQLQRKYNIYDLGYLTKNSQIPAIPPQAAVPFAKTPDTSQFISKYNVYDLNLLWPNSQIPGIPVPFQAPFSLYDSGYQYKTKYSVWDNNRASSQLPQAVPVLITVPNIVTLTQPQAISLLSTFQLSLFPTTQISTATPGTIIQQFPFAGSQAAQGTIVFGTVATPQTTVPDVVGMTQAAATAILRAAQLGTAVSTQYSNTIPPGIVVSQNPLAGSIVAALLTVQIVVTVGFAGAGPVLGDFSGGTTQGDFT